MIKRSKRAVTVAAAAALVLAACGSDDDAADEPADEPAEEEAADEPAEEPAEEEAADDEAMDDEAMDEEAMDEEPAEEEAAVDTLVIWADELKIEPLEAVVPAFTEATGVEVQIELVPFGDIRDQVTQAGPAGEGPDLFAGAHDWTGELAANGIIDPVDVSAIADQFVPVALDGFNFEGQNYAVPYATEAIALYRNTDLVPDAPATWDDLVASCEAAAVENCVTIPGGGDASDAYHNYPFVSAYGGYIFGFDEATGFDAADIGLDAPETVEGIALLEEGVASGIIPSTNYDGAKNLFLEGQAAYWITGPWELGGLQEQDAINFDVSVIPQIGEAPAQPFVGAQGFFQSSFSEKGLLAQSFLLDFIASDETMQALYDADPRGAAWVTVEQDPAGAAFIDSAANGIPMPNITQMGSVWGPLGDNILLVRNGELGATDAMTASADAVRAAVEG